MSTILDTVAGALPAGCTARALTPDDVDDTFAVYAAAQRHDVGALVMERADIVADWSRPSMDLTTDTVGVLRGDRLVAAAEARRRGPRAEAAVHPDARGLGIGTWLVAWTEAWALAGGGASVGQTVPEGSAGHRLLAALGYRDGHTSWVLELPEGATVPERPLPGGYALRDAVSAPDLQAAYGVVQRAFGEWSDRTGVTYDEWAAGTVRRPGYAPWQVRVVAHEEGGVVGVAFTVVDEQECGYVAELAVAREHRGRGLAQALLADAFRGAREHGATRSELSTDSRTGALDLYLRVGMVVTSTWQHLLVDLPRGGGGDGGPGGFS
ncbi:GNAT family N-acetyltransferase [Phycicoccus flavus]|uniref:GNAT family N-acetyltransferase n=1 Tax=Phycicoccus flavus TaxID=2502783 RepID=UPI000FEBDA96|nr:GNAT family N-acetyltransferase [Phycicoccus flavus]NHA69098.1 GNAT family N-acetyltransferase [Phycicoccus flavus]